jgi:uncharacterized protein YdhG (YjbR/CyaY superfamily)
MQSKASTIRDYISGLSSNEQSVIRTLDKIVRSAAPKGSGSMKFGMPTYEMASCLIAFNSQKNYFSLYADPAVVKRHRAELRDLDVGKSCIRFRKIEDISLATLRKIVSECAK